MTKKVGRPKSGDPLIYRTVGLTADQWRWLALWHESNNPGAQLRELLERAVKFWPGGPRVFRGEKIDQSGWLQSCLPDTDAGCSKKV